MLFQMHVISKLERQKLKFHQHSRRPIGSLFTFTIFRHIICHKHNQVSRSHHLPFQPGVETYQKPFSSNTKTQTHAKNRDEVQTPSYRITGLGLSHYVAIHCAMLDTEVQDICYSKLLHESIWSRLG